VTEVDPDGKVVWQWFAKDHLKTERRHPVPTEKEHSYAHTNSVSRLANGNTLISLRNFHMIVEVDPAGEIIWSLRDLPRVHNPEILANGNILFSTHRPHRTVEVTREGDRVWVFERGDIKTVRYNHRLPNGNTLLVERTKIIEVAKTGEIVWQVSLKNVNSRERTAKDRWLYKGERLPVRN
jgi:hypothetical protein